MTFEQMQSEAELLYEVNSSAAPGFTSEEWGQFFTIGQRRVVLRILSDGVFKDAFNSQAISKIIQTDDYEEFVHDDFFRNSDRSPAFRLDPDGKAFDSKFFWILDEYVDTGEATNIAVKHITYDFYRVNLQNPFRAPDYSEGFWILQYGNFDPNAAISVVPVFITDGTPIVKYHILGVHHPDNYPIGPGISYPVNEASCLNTSVHSRIVEEAVAMARMSIVDPQGYQLAVADFSR